MTKFGDKITQNEYKHSLTFRVRAMLSWQRKPCTDCKSAQQCTRRSTPTIPPSYIRDRAVVWECGEGQADTQTHIQTAVTTIHFASSTTHAKYIIRINYSEQPNVIFFQTYCKIRQLFGRRNFIEGWRDNVTSHICVKKCTASVDNQFRSSVSTEGRYPCQQYDAVVKPWFDVEIKLF